MRSRLRWAAALVVAAAAAAAVWFTWFLAWADLPAALAEPKPLTTVLLDAKGRIIAELAGPEARSHRPLPLSAMGPWLPGIAVTLEDRRFYSHPGVDLLATARALVRRHGGGSTITQQFVKVAMGRRGRSLSAKLREMLWALQLERRRTKPQILEAYLNRIPFGNRLIGVEAAAQAYFKKPAAALTRSEALYLAGLPREPSRLNPWRHPAAAARRFARLQPQFANCELPEVSRQLPQTLAPHYVQAVIRRISHGAGAGPTVTQASNLCPEFGQFCNPKGIPAFSPGLRGTSYPGKTKCGINPKEGCDRTRTPTHHGTTLSGVDGTAPKSQGCRSPRTACGNPGLEGRIPLGLPGIMAKPQTQASSLCPDHRPEACVTMARGVIRCTLDLDLQRRAEQLVREHLEILRRPDITQAAMVVIENSTSSVRALVGSRDFNQSQINGALKFRNCGSTLKPFLYVTGIQRRVLTAATLLPDTGDAARDAYRDYDPHNFVLSHLGPVRVREALGNSLNVPAVVAVSRIGAHTAFDAIQNWGIRFDHPLEQAGAGFILGNVGVRLLDLTAAFAGLARGGLASPPRLLADEPTPFKRVVSPEAAEIVDDILCDNSARLQSFGSRSSLAFPVRIGAKTGTSAGFRDAWAVGFTREHTVGVWVGNFDGRPMDHAASIASAAPLWRRTMDDLLQTDRPVPEPKLRRVPVCALTGLCPCPRSPSTVGELFLPGTEPTDSAGAWFAPDGHPVLPGDYAGWCASADNFLHATLRPDPEKLAILSPREGAVFVLDRSLPLAQQQMELQANQPEGVSWKINGEPLTPRGDGRVLWQLKPGQWTVEAATRLTKACEKFEVLKER